MIPIIPDANIFIKLFSNEPDSPRAKALFTHCISNDIKQFVPELFKYEVLALACKKNAPFENTLNVLEKHINTLITIVSPSQAIWLKSKEITLQGHKNSGFPSLYDSVYHALAIELNGLFITADKKHYDKAKSLGNIALLDEWESNIKGTH
ncbi:MAG: putative nucleic acid-binding protein [Candidatus Endobugula sp.]|jgi:predicted nucleic acid-binding protein